MYEMISGRISSLLSLESYRVVGSTLSDISSSSPRDIFHLSSPLCLASPQGLTVRGGTEKEEGEKKRRKHPERFTKAALL